MNIYIKKVTTTSIFRFFIFTPNNGVNINKTRQTAMATKVLTNSVCPPTSAFAAVLEKLLKRKFFKKLKKKYRKRKKKTLQQSVDLLYIYFKKHFTTNLVYNCKHKQYNTHQQRTRLQHCSSRSRSIQYRRPFPTHFHSHYCGIVCRVQQNRHIRLMTPVH